MAAKYQIEVYSGDTETVQWPITHGVCGTNILLSEVSAATITLRDEGSGGIVNSRSAQSILNGNNGTIADGSLTMAFRAADTTLVDSTAAEEIHTAAITLTLTDGQKRTIEVELRCRKAPATT